MLLISPSKLGGRIAPPPSKSQSLRAILFASLAKGVSTIDNLLDSPDVDAMKRGCSLLGARFEGSQKMTVEGIGGYFQTPDQVIDVGNSGITLRFLMGVAALSKGVSVFTGDASIRSQRTVSPLLDGLNQLKVTAFSTRGNGLAPVIVQGPLLGGHVEIDGTDSQPVSALLIALSMASCPSTLCVKNPGEKPWVDLTLDWLKRLGVSFQREGYERFFLPGRAQFQPFQYRVPADLSSLSFPLVAAVITDSQLVIEGVDLHDLQGDKKILSILQSMGASIEIGEGVVTVFGKGNLKGVTVDINDCIDTLPILSVLAAFAMGKTRLLGASVARGKESNRIAVMCNELSKMGISAVEEEDGICIEGGQAKGAFLSSHGDHRVAMSLAVCALGATGESRIDEILCIDKTYPEFVKAFQGLGALMV